MNKQLKWVLRVINIGCFLALILSCIVPIERKETLTSNIDVSSYGNLHSIPRIGSVTDEKQMKLKFNLYDEKLYGVNLYFGVDGDDENGKVTCAIEYNTGALAYDATTNTVKVTWKIVKKDLANTTVEISETNGKLTATVLNGKVIVPATEYDVKDNGDGTATVTAKADSKSYKGSQKVSVKKSENVGAPVISNVNVSGNTATVILSGETDGASGYDYVISTSKDPANKDARLDVVKNQVQTTANFKYVPQGTYYAYCHAWTRDENGKKVFGGWSNSYAFSVTAITPDTPEILSVKTKGSTITVTYKES